MLCGVRTKVKPARAQKPGKLGAFLRRNRGSALASYKITRISMGLEPDKTSR